MTATPTETIIGHTTRGIYKASHPAEAARLARRDPARLSDGETVRLAHPAVIVVVCGEPEVVRVKGEHSTWTLRAPVRVPTSFETCIHGQIEFIEASLCKAARDAA